MTKKILLFSMAVMLTLMGCSKENEPKDNDKNQDTIEDTLLTQETIKQLLEDMVYVEGGTFFMGAQNSDSDGLNYDADIYSHESPVHEVTLDSYYIGKYEVTQGLWKKVMGVNPSLFTGDDNLPVEYVSWNDCQTFITRLNQLTGQNFRMPTEAEWEYAARGGQQDEYIRTKGQSGTYCKYAGSNDIDDVAWYDGNSGGKTHPVGTKAPNALGLYDMSGNVWEWCSDWYDYYNSSPATNPTGSATGIIRMLRGGYWGGNTWNSRVSRRNYNAPDYRNLSDGLRLVLPL